MYFIKETNLSVSTKRKFISWNGFPCALITQKSFINLMLITCSSDEYTKFQTSALVAFISSLPRLFMEYSIF